MPSGLAQKDMRALVTERLLQLVREGLDSASYSRRYELFDRACRSRPRADKRELLRSATEEAVSEIALWAETASDAELLDRALDAVKS